MNKEIASSGKLGLLKDNATKSGYWKNNEGLQNQYECERNTSAWNDKRGNIKEVGVYQWNGGLNRKYVNKIVNRYWNKIKLENSKKNKNRNE